MMNELLKTITDYEFDDIGNLIVTTTEADAIQKTVSSIAKNIVLSRPVTIKENVNDQQFKQGYLFSIHEFMTDVLAKHLKSNIDSETWIADACRLRAPKSFKSVYITGKKKKQCLDTYEPPLTQNDRVQKQVESIVSKRLEKEDRKTELLKTLPPEIKIVSAEITLEGLEIGLDDNKQMTDLRMIIESVFDYEEKPLSKFNGKINGRTQFFVFSKIEFDMYRLFQTQFDHYRTIETAEIIDCKYDADDHVKNAWDFKGFILPTDYILKINGMPYQGSNLVVSVEKKFSIFDDVQYGDIIACTNGFIGVVSDKNNDSVSVRYYVNEEGNFVNTNIRLNVSYIRSYDAHLATDEEKAKMYAVIQQAGYIIDEKTQTPVQKYPWLKINTYYYIPEFKDGVFVSTQRMFSGTPEEFAFIYSGNKTIFQYERKCRELCNEYNDSIALINRKHIDE